MPLVHIDMLEGRSADYHAAVLEAVREALVGTVDVVHERIIQRIHQVGPGCLDIPAGKSEQALIIEVTMLEGRSPEKKAALYDEIRTRLAADPGIDPADVFVIVRDTPRGDVCLGTPIDRA